MVLIYTKSSCGPCRTLKYWLDKKHIDYKELPPTKDMFMVPQIKIGSEIIVGLDWPRLSELLVAPRSTA